MILGTPLSLYHFMSGVFWIFVGPELTRSGMVGFTTLASSQAVNGLCYISPFLSKMFGIWKAIIFP